MLVFNKVLLFVATTFVALLISAFLAVATSTDPMQVAGSNLPQRVLMRDQETGAFSFSFTNKVPGKFPVATFRWGGEDFQMVTGWFYLQITSRASTLKSSFETAQKEFLKISSNTKMSKMAKLAARRKATPNEAKLSIEGLRAFSTKPVAFAPVSGADNAFYAGLIEGYLLAQQGRATAPQYSSGKTTYPACQTKWIADHFTYIQNMIQKSMNGQLPSAGTAYWQQFGRLWAQLDGLAAGHNMYGGSNYTVEDIYLSNMATDAMDLYCKETTGKYEHSKNHVTTVDKTSVGWFKKQQGIVTKGGLPGGPLHCSALVKNAGSNFYSSHITWSGFDYQFGIRAYKTYSIGDVNTVTFSGRMDFTISSVDDFYQIYGYGGSAGVVLSVWETTMEIFNLTLYKNAIPQQTEEFSRVMVSNFISQSAKGWAENFASYAGSSYCNSYVAIDANKFVPSNFGPANQQPDFLWVSEQIPGYVETRDMTPFLNQNSYWPSFNIPAFDYIYNVSGNRAMYIKEGNFFTWDKYARPAIFARNQSAIKELSDMMHMMRYNDWKNDNLSDIAIEWNKGCEGATNNECSPKRSAMYSIASRGDLMTVYPTEAEMIAHYGSTNYVMSAQGCFGAVDAKIFDHTSNLNGDRVAYIINGPTSDQQPVFDWSGSCNGKIPERTMKTLDYPWVQLSIVNEDN